MSNVAENVIRLASSLLTWQEKIEEALRRAGNTHSFNDIAQEVIVGAAHFYDYGDCCILMKVIQFPRFKNYHCFIACGNMESLMQKQEDIRKVAKELGCKEMTINGRPGWSRVLKENGWTHRLSLLYAEV